MTYWGDVERERAQAQAGLVRLGRARSAAQEYLSLHPAHLRRDEALVTRMARKHKVKKDEVLEALHDEVTKDYLQ